MKRTFSIAPFQFINFTRTNRQELFYLRCTCCLAAPTSTYLSVVDSVTKARARRFRSALYAVQRMAICDERRKKSRQSNPLTADDV